MKPHPTKEQFKIFMRIKDDMLGHNIEDETGYTFKEWKHILECELFTYKNMKNLLSSGISSGVNRTPERHEVQKNTDRRAYNLLINNLYH